MLHFIILKGILFFQGTIPIILMIGAFILDEIMEVQWCH